MVGRLAVASNRFPSRAAAQLDCREYSFFYMLANCRSCDEHQLPICPGSPHGYRSPDRPQYEIALS